MKNPSPGVGDISMNTRSSKALNFRLQMQVYPPATKGGKHAETHIRSEDFDPYSRMFLGGMYSDGEGDEEDEYKTLVDHIVSLYGTDGASTRDVMKEYLPKYHPQVKHAQIDLNHAYQVVASEQPLLLTFYMTQVQWSAFARFWRGKSDPEAVFSCKDLPEASGTPRSDAEVENSPYRYDDLGIRFVDSMVSMLATKHSDMDSWGWACYITSTSIVDRRPI